MDVGGQTIGAIGPGLLVLVCAEPTDTPATAERLLAKVLKLRIFGDEAGKMNLSVQDVQGGLLIVSQFTLAADTRSGNRPGFKDAAPPDQGACCTNTSSIRPAPNTPRSPPVSLGPTCR